MIPTLVDALRALRPNDSFIVRGEIAYENIQLADKNKTKLAASGIKEPLTTSILAVVNVSKFASCFDFVFAIVFSYL